MPRYQRNKTLKKIVVSTEDFRFDIYSDTLTTQLSLNLVILQLANYLKS